MADWGQAKHNKILKEKKIMIKKLYPTFFFMVLKSFIMDFVRGRGSNNTVKGIKDSIGETNLGKHH